MLAAADADADATGADAGAGGELTAEGVAADPVPPVPHEARTVVTTMAATARLRAFRCIGMMVPGGADAHQ